MSFRIRLVNMNADMHTEAWSVRLIS